MKTMTENTTMKTTTENKRTFRAAKLSGLLLIAAAVFAGCATSSADKAAYQAAAARPMTVVLREGDVLKISFPGSSNLDTTQPVRRDGKIALPLVGEVVAAGLTPEELQRKLVGLYADQISSKIVTVAVQSSAFPVYVTGSVVRPGKILSDHPITALEAVMEAGGFTFATANMTDVKIIRHENGGVRNFTVNLKLALNGQRSEPFYLKPSDIVYVPERFTLF